MVNFEFYLLWIKVYCLCFPESSGNDRNVHRISKHQMGIYGNAHTFRGNGRKSWWCRRWLQNEECIIFNIIGRILYLFSLRGNTNERFSKTRFCLKIFYKPIRSWLKTLNFFWNFGHSTRKVSFDKNIKFSISMMIFSRLIFAFNSLLSGFSTSNNPWLQIKKKIRKSKDCLVF